MKTIKRSISFSIVGIISCLVLSSCTSDTHDSKNTTIDSTILIFDVRKYSRKEIAVLIQSACNYRPRIIAINLLFDSLSDAKTDSSLTTSLKSCKTILSANIENNEIHRSADLFTMNSANEGVLSYIIDDHDMITEYIPLYEDEKMQLMSFPDIIAIEYLGADEFEISDYVINKIEKIDFNSERKSFIYLDSVGLASHLIEDRIIIMDDFSTREKNKISFGFITASLVLRIIEKKVIKNQPTKR
jgi:hypothetical protein